MFGANQTGMQMMVKALLPSLGIEPETFGKKVIEFEQLFKRTLTEVHGKVLSIEERLERIETMLLILTNQTEQKLADVIPAGETWAEHETTAVVKSVGQAISK